MTQSCSTCVHRMSAHSDEQSRAYGQTYRFDTCAVTAAPLSAINNIPFGQRFDADTEVQQSLGANCSHYKEDDGARRSRDGRAQPKVYINLGVSIPVGPVQDRAGAKPSTCMSCHFHVPSGTVAEQNLNVTDTGVCSKFARLIPEARALAIGSGCREGVQLDIGNTVAHRDKPFADMSEVIRAHHKQLLSSIMVSPVIGKYIDFTSTDLSDSPSTDRSTTSSVQAIIEPSTYETDKPVGPKARAAGIRAFRSLKSPDGKREVFIPVFDAEYFDVTERAKIPQTFSDDHPEDYNDHLGLAYTVAVLWLELDETPALHGKAGTGKTELYRYLAWLMQLPFERININNTSDIDSLAGYTHFENNETVFKYGRVPKSFSKPCVLLIDEPNVGPDDVWQFFRPLTDNSKQLALDMNEGEIIERHAFSFMGMAMNPAWDPLNIGAKEISDADGSRLMHIFVDLPDPEVEAGIIKRHCVTSGYEIDDDMVRLVMRIAHEIRALCEAGTLNMSWGIRHQIKVAAATKWFDVRTAYRMAAADYLDPQRKELLLGVVRDHTR